jgi:hypothetical protein
MITLENIIRFNDGEMQDEEEFDFMQELINNGVAWRGEPLNEYARNYIEAGFCSLPPRPFYDLYGIRVPSRYEILPGDPGSVEQVILQRSKGKQ